MLTAMACCPLPTGRVGHGSAPWRVTDASEGPLLRCCEGAWGSQTRGPTDLVACATILQLCSSAVLLILQLCSFSCACWVCGTRAQGGGAAAARRRPLAELLCGGGGGPCHSPTAAPVAQWRRCAHRRAAGCTGRTTGNHRPGMEPVREIEKRFSEVRAAPAAFTRASPVLTDCVLPVHCLGLCAVRGAADTADGLR